MDEATYTALSEGTHPIYQQARGLGLEIKPGQKTREIQKMEMMKNDKT